MTFVGFAVIFCLGALILWAIYTYNIFREKQSLIDFWWDEAEIHLQFRRDLIPGLLDRARPIMKWEDQRLDRIAGIREEIIQNEIHQETDDLTESIERLENSLSAEFHLLQDAFRQHAEIQVNPELLTVMSELASIEGKAVTACEEYNKLTHHYNSLIKSFPANLVVGMLHFSPKEKRIFGAWQDTAQVT
ncbi:MAG: LemA family protein [Synergistaceae bacterium]|jgi:LemA protein|nr:LemA family protein [Synergistaceae bacterium]